MGARAWRQVLAGKEIETGTARAQMVERVGRRLASVSGRDLDWTFRLVRDDEVVNAFCLPGGRVAVYTGLLPVTANEHGLAAVMGHEIGHVLARHGGERVSQQMLADGALAVIGHALGGAGPEVQRPVLAALGLGTEVGLLLPYSRLHEHEADAIGVRLMVRAGYNPHEAVRVWQRMAALGGPRGPAMLSTHPEPRERADRIARLVPRIVAEER